MCVLCLCGPASEEYFCGPITDASDQTDVAMAREYLGRAVEALHIGVPLARHRASADRLVRTAWARSCIPVIAAALLERETLTGADIGATRPD